MSMRAFYHLVVCQSVFTMTNQCVPFVFHLMPILCDYVCILWMFLSILTSYYSCIMKTIMLVRVFLKEPIVVGMYIARTNHEKSMVPNLYSLKIWPVIPNPGSKLPRGTLRAFSVVSEKRSFSSGTIFYNTLLLNTTKCSVYFSLIPP